MREVEDVLLEPHWTTLSKDQVVLFCDVKGITDNVTKEGFVLTRGTAEKGNPRCANDRPGVEWFDRPRWRALCLYLVGIIILHKHQVVMIRGALCPGLVSSQGQLERDQV
ncbi:hypothetical protein RRG08_000929 [Elysia crispata]|uniref:Uncharacterized protein n=1 Tax=Elysia crispata TaxID=231223 RepID=A0AAE1D9W3_9GAST|nr:hypothetical protein RRG08_000929 [Elysia crispata]